jgi:pimeloyl-ACP methyl ester carboxylesterase
MTSYETLEHGQGAPLLFLHGMMGGAENWQRVFPHLPDRCQALALRLPFFQSELALHSVRAVADYAEGFLDRQGLPEAVLCGNSLGGHVGLTLALRSPQRVRGLVLTGSSGLFERTFATVGPHPPRQWVYDKIAEIFYDKSQVTDALVDRVIEIISVRRNVRNLVKIAKSAKRDNLAEHLKEIRCPVLLVWGRCDEITPPGVAEEFHRKLPASDLVWLERCGHAPMMERPAQFGRAVRQWWDRRIASRPAARADEVAQ